MNHKPPQSRTQRCHDETAEGDTLNAGSVEKTLDVWEEAGVWNRKLERTDTTENTAENRRDRIKKMILLANAYTTFVMSWEISRVLHTLLNASHCSRAVGRWASPANTRSLPVANEGNDTAFHANHQGQRSLSAKQLVYEKTIETVLRILSHLSKCIGLKNLERAK